ncbi:MAG: hypothetical protein ABEK84_07300, partial [Salinibacter sp.]
GLGLSGQVVQAEDGAVTPPDTADTPTIVVDDEPDDEDPNNETSAAESAAPQDDGPSLSVDINGSLRFNALFRSYDSNLAVDQSINEVLANGGFTFDTFR